MSAFRTAVTVCLALAVCLAGGPASALPAAPCTVTAADDAVRPDSASADAAPHACCGAKAASVESAGPARGCCGENCRCGACPTAGKPSTHVCGCGAPRPAPVAPEPGPRQVVQAVDAPPAGRPDDAVRPLSVAFDCDAAACVRSSRFAQLVLSVWLT
ncbi:hypothetical protein [Alienimonas sp. DA493]|uniref:hypothetical protein n=1 Tax=Alienimonas sp. DA493 TaxID=3373605 RepID=UPI0037544A69